MKKIFLILLLMVSCSKKEDVVSVDALPEINADTETSLLVWGWDLAAEALEDVAVSFNEKYPNIKIEVVNIGYTGKNQKISVVLNSGEGMPDVFMDEAVSVGKFAESFPHRLLDMKDMFYEGWQNDVDAAQLANSTDTIGRVVAVPWDTGPVVMFYREDYFRDAQIDPASIVTWDDFIREGKKLEAALPDIKMIAFYHTRSPIMWTMIMQSANNFVLNPSNEVTLNSPLALDSLNLIRKMVREDAIVLDGMNWDGLVRAAVDETVATFIMGSWWSAPLLKQAPDHSGKWRVMKMPTLAGYEEHAAAQGGSTLLVSAVDPIKQAAAVAFIEHALLNVDSQIMMYEDYSYIPSYLPAYNDERMKRGAEYFGGQDVTSIFREVIGNVAPDQSYTSESATIDPLVLAAYEYATTTDEDLATVLNDISAQIEEGTGHKIAK